MFYWSMATEQRSDPKRRADSEFDISGALPSEDRDVLSAASTALAENTNPGEWMPLAKLYSEVSLLDIAVNMSWFVPILCA